MFRKHLSAEIFRACERLEMLALQLHEHIEDPLFDVLLREFLELNEYIDDLFLLEKLQKDL